MDRRWFDWRLPRPVDQDDAPFEYLDSSLYYILEHTIRFAPKMSIVSVGNFIIEVTQMHGAGGNWLVRVYRKLFLFKKRVSSDWFLDETQARTFAEQIASHLKTNGSSTFLEKRPPGWTLRRPPR